MKTAGMLLRLEVLENRTLLSAIPNDPLLSYQWGLDCIGSKNAWSYSTGSNSIVVAVIDSGIDLNHADLKDNMWINPGEIAGDGIDNENNGYIDDVYGWNFANNSNNIQDGFGHGTHVAGIIGATGNNGLGVVGVNWDVKIMSLKFIDDSGVGDTGGVIRAMDYALEMKRDYGINIVAINNSWGGGTGFSNLLYNKIVQLKDYNIICVTAAGNSGVNSDESPRYPGSFDLDNIINVGALSSDKYSLAGYSNYGVVSVDIAAPGTGIYSTIKNNSYGYKSGTSMAAPFVTGAIALLNSVKPNMVVAEIRDAIFGSADKVYSLFDKVAAGGKLNVGSAVCRVLNMPYSTNTLPDGAIVSTNFRTISGWAKDPNSAITTVKLIVDGTDQSLVTVDSSYKFVFSLDQLAIGHHNIDIDVKDEYSGEWKNIGSVEINIPAPVVEVNYLRTNKIKGWAYSERSVDSVVVIKVVVNGKIVSSDIANRYRPNLVSVTGSAYRGFNIKLKRSWFLKGTNNISILVSDPVSGQLEVGWAGIING